MGSRRVEVSWSVIAAAFVLLAGIAMVAYLGLSPLPEPKFKGCLADTLPKAEDVPGWEIRQEQIADTPEMKKAVSELLNYDDAVFATYTRGAERVSIYIAYWKPGQISQRLVAGHTPDVCWVGNGWSIMYKGEAPLFICGGERTKPAQARHMRYGEIVEIVLFWHFAGSDLAGYSDGPPPWYALFSDLWKKGARQREEQVFVRLSAPALVGDITKTPVVNEVLCKLKNAHVPIVSSETN